MIADGVQSIRVVVSVHMLGEALHQAASKPSVLSLRIVNLEVFFKQGIDCSQWSGVITDLIRVLTSLRIIVEVSRAPQQRVLIFQIGRDRKNRSSFPCVLCIHTFVLVANRDQAHQHALETRSCRVGQSIAQRL